MERDYIISKVDNLRGELCPQYPAIIPIPESPRSVTTIYENEDETLEKWVDISDLTPLYMRGNIARCRQRFPVPVIQVNGKYICRSSTLASEPELCYRTGLISSLTSLNIFRGVKELWWPVEGLVPETYDEEEPQDVGIFHIDQRARSVCDKVRTIDIKILNKFKVNAIVDIMVEKRKVKHSC